jgi:hypothetical protein
MVAENFGYEAEKRPTKKVLYSKKLLDRGAKRDLNFLD